MHRERLETLFPDLQMNELPVGFKRKAVEPFICMKEGWKLVRDQYWLFVGMIFVAMLVNWLVPFCVLLGPMMCGVYLCMFRRQHNEPVEFATLFKGFDYFGPSLIATLLHIVPIFIIMFPMFVVILLAPLLLGPLQRGYESNPGILILIIGLAAILVVLLFGILVVLNVIILPLSFASVFIAYTQVFGPSKAQWASPLTQPAPSYR